LALGLRVRVGEEIVVETIICGHSANKLAIVFLQIVKLIKINAVAGCQSYQAIK
jgi:hypothetical protein